jgi:EAL domain-containing protein (putative c-di-GMP-specific phosphodiesterase class I)/GGDEF domain-containing protein
MNIRKKLLGWKRSSADEKHRETPLREMPISALVERLEQDIQRQTPSAVVALLMITLSRSDNIEAMLRKPGCAEVQEELVRRVRSTLHEHDYLAVSSANEIWVTLPKLSSSAVANLAASNLIRSLETPIAVSGTIVTVRPVIGIAIAAQSGCSALQLLKGAANAESRAHSLNQRYWATVTNNITELSARDRIAAIQSALAHNRLSVFYQPKIDLRSGRISGAEALIRWNDDSHPEITTSMLIDTAEQHGMIQELTRFVMNIVLREYVESLAKADIGKIWINLSASMLRDAKLPEMLDQITRVWGVSAEVLGLEVTESTLLTDVEQSITTLHALVACGFSLAIDDFGTGYSSMVYLRRFPVSELKIDRLFVQHMMSSLPDRQIVRSIIDLAHNFQLTVVAEGAEDQSTLAHLKEMQCDQVQGYVYANPMSAADLLAWTQQYRKNA